MRMKIIKLEDFFLSDRYNRESSNHPEAWSGLLQNLLDLKVQQSIEMDITAEGVYDGKEIERFYE